MPKDNWKKENNRATYGPARFKYSKKEDPTHPAKKKKKKGPSKKKDPSFVTKRVKKETMALERVRMAKKYAREKILDERFGLSIKATKTNSIAYRAKQNEIEIAIDKELQKLKVRERELKAKPKSKKKLVLQEYEEGRGKKRATKKQTLPSRLKGKIKYGKSKKIHP